MIANERITGAGSTPAGRRRGDGVTERTTMPGLFERCKERGIAGDRASVSNESAAGAGATGGQQEKKQWAGTTRRSRTQTAAAAPAEGRCAGDPIRRSRIL